jgi:MFS family permease
MLRERDVAIVVGAVGVSAAGDFVLWIALTLHLQETTGSGMAIAALLICLWAPIVLLAPVAGLAVDRFETRRVLVLASIGQLAAGTALALVLDSTAATLALAAVLGVGFAFSQPAEFALVPVIAGTGRTAAVNGYVEAARYAGAMLGPVLGGALFALAGAQAAVLVNAATFGAVALGALALRTRRPPTPHEDRRGERIRDGLTVLFRDRELGLVVTVVFASLLIMTASVAAEVFFLTEDLGVSDLVYGLVFACWTGAMVLGSLVVARRVPGRHLAVGVLAATAVQGAGLGLPVVWLVAWFCALMWAVGGAAHGTKNVLVRTLIQERVDSRLHGRAFAAYNGLRNGAELVALAAGGLLVAALGGRATLAVAGAASSLAGVVGLLVHARRAPGRERAP